MEKLKRSPAELLAEVEIKSIEQECLDRVFDWISKSPAFYKPIQHSL